jgi:hypothetical protein
VLKDDSATTGWIEIPSQVHATPKVTAGQLNVSSGGSPARKNAEDFKIHA